jgi:hypothetical protein
MLPPTTPEPRPQARKKRSADPYNGVQDKHCRQYIDRWGYDTWHALAKRQKELPGYVGDGLAFGYMVEACLKYNSKVPPINWRELVVTTPVEAYYSWPLSYEEGYAALEEHPDLTFSCCGYRDGKPWFQVERLKIVEPIWPEGAGPEPGPVPELEVEVELEPEPSTVHADEITFALDPIDGTLAKRIVAGAVLPAQQLLNYHFAVEPVHDLRSMFAVLKEGVKVGALVWCPPEQRWRSGAAR